MNIYEDLSYYSNWHFEYALNIGWLPLNNEKSKVQNNNSILLEILIPYLEYPFNMVRDNLNTVRWQYKEKTYVLGFSEIMVY